VTRHAAVRGARRATRRRGCLQQPAPAASAAGPGRLPALLHRVRPPVLLVRRRRQPCVAADDRQSGQHIALRRGGRAMTVAEKVVNRVSNRLGRRQSRRSFLVKTAVIGSALAVNPWRYILKPGTAYASLCGPDADCGSGWTAMCCTINEGQNTCPPGTLPAGWWKADNSGFCAGGPRYYIDCNSTCSTCGCGASGICGSSCWSCG